jgi:hypothetical protein
VEAGERRMSEDELTPDTIIQVKGEPEYTRTNIEVNLWYPFYVDMDLNVQRPILHFLDTSDKYLCNIRVSITFPSREELKRVLKELLNQLEGADEKQRQGWRRSKND